MSDGDEGVVDTEVAQDGGDVVGSSVDGEQAGVGVAGFAVAADVDKDLAHAGNGFDLQFVFGGGDVEAVCVDDGQAGVAGADVVVVDGDAVAVKGAGAHHNPSCPR